MTEETEKARAARTEKLAKALRDNLKRRRQRQSKGQSNGQAKGQAMGEAAIVRNADSDS